LPTTTPTAASSATMPMPLAPATLSRSLLRLSSWGTRCHTFLSRTPPPALEIPHTVVRPFCASGFARCIRANPDSLPTGLREGGQDLLGDQVELTLLVESDQAQGDRRDALLDERLQLFDTLLDAARRHPPGDDVMPVVHAVVGVQEPFALEHRRLPV